MSTELRAVACMVKGPPLRYSVQCTRPYLLSYMAYYLFYDASAEIKTATIIYIIMRSGTILY